jgi:hypothetical protein
MISWQQIIVLRFSRPAITSLLILFSPMASSEDDDFNPFKTDIDEYFVPGEAWKESVASIPPYPKQDDLVYFPVDAGDSRFKYAIDSKSLKVGKDEVVRYSIVIESTSGVQNTMYEGIRCDNGEHKTYAYGTSEKKFIEAKNIKWKPIEFGISGSMAYRSQLHNYFFCTNNLPVKQQIILQRLKYEANRVDSDTTFW